MKANMKKNAVAVNPIAKTITISKAYYKKACIYGTSEYYEFRTVLSENEGFTVDFKVIEKKTYKSLTFERMEEYIKTQPNSQKQLEAQLDALMDDDDSVVEFPAAANL